MASVITYSAIANGKANQRFISHPFSAPRHFALPNIRHGDSGPNLDSSRVLESSHFCLDYCRGGCESLRHAYLAKARDIARELTTTDRYLADRLCRRATMSFRSVGELR
jgi:hypothetical protein